MINAQGGVNGRKIDLVSLDDSFDPKKTLALTKKLVEQDHVALIFSTTGGPQNAAIRPYLNDNKVPPAFHRQHFPRKPADYKNFPWTVGGVPVFRIESQIYGR